MTMMAQASSREESILKYYPLVQRIAHRVHQKLPNAVDIQDLVSNGVLGLVEALDRYDPSHAVPLRVYAKYRIHGAMMDSLRHSDWVPRSVRRKAGNIENTRAHLRLLRGKEPSRGDLAEALSMSAEKYDSYEADSQIHPLLSLDRPAGDDFNTPLIERVSDGSDLANSWQKKELTKAVITEITQLPTREKTAIALYYLHDLNLKEVGEVLGVSESRACQLRGQGIKRLRKRLASLF